MITFQFKFLLHQSNIVILVNLKIDNTVFSQAPIAKIPFKEIQHEIETNLTCMLNAMKMRGKSIILSVVPILVIKIYLI